MGLIDRRAEADAKRGAPPNGRPRPTPAAGAAAAAPTWEEPIPLPAAGDPPPFPLDVLPPALADFVSSVAESTNTPPDYAATYLLGVSAGLIGATRAVRVGPDWAEMTVLYAVVVADKSAGKTPAFSAVMRPVNVAQALRAREHRAEDKKPPRLVYVKDFTVESLAPLLKEYPRGLMVARDEVSGWARSFGQYKGGAGSDRQFWLANWGGEPVDVLRKNPESPHVHVPYPCVSVVGGIQPPVLGDLRQDRDDGMIERMLFAYPARLPAAAYNRRPVAGVEDWGRAARTLLDFQMHRDHAGGGERPFFHLLGEDAELVFDFWTEEVADMCNAPDRVKEFDGTRTKMRGTVARIATVLHNLWGVASGGHVEATIGPDAMVRAVNLGRYYLDHAAGVHGIAGADDRPGKVLDWLRRSGKAAVTRRDVHRGLQRHFRSADELAAPLRTLCQHGFLNVVRDEAAGGRGQAVYMVNPAVVTAVNEVSPPTGDTSSGVGSKA